MKNKLTHLQAFNTMTLYLDKYYIMTNSDDIGSLLGGFQLFEEGGTWDPAAWHDWIGSVNKILDIKNEKNKVEETLTISQSFKTMILFLEKYYELTSYDDIAIILSPLYDFEKNHNLESPAWKNWTECINKVLHENYQNIGSLTI